MTGLLKKDVLLFKEELFSWILLMAASILLVKFLNDLGVEISVCLVLTTVCMQVLNTLTSDQANHGLTFLMTLPITKKQYVNEKYFLLLGSSMFATAVMMALTTICLGVFNLPQKFIVTFSMSYVTEIFLVLLFEILLSYQLNHGAEKTQTFMAVLGTVIAVIGSGIIYLIKTITLANQWYQQLHESFTEHGYSLPLLILSILFVGIFSIIWGRSVKQFKKQEF